MTPLRILILEDNDQFVDSLARGFHGRIEIVATPSISKAKRLINAHIDLALVDLFLTDEQSKPEGLDFLRWVVSQGGKVPVIVITGYGSTDLAVVAMRDGADDFIDKGRLSLQEIETRICNTLERRRLRSRVTELEHRLETYEPTTLVGSSQVMEQLRRSIKTVAEDGQITVLLRGESGTGKELAARLIHSQGKRHTGPFVAADLSTLPKETIASELFGHERGAFTGADTARTGYVEAAHAGVLFLDEIAELPRDLQNRLFRVLEERAVTPIGCTRPRPVDIQLVTATNQDLEKLVKAGAFRAELYYRLRVFEIRLPALREHCEDVIELSDYFLAQWRASGRTPLHKITAEAADVLKRYSWPGNVRELRNVLEAACVRAKMLGRKELSLDLLPADVRVPATVMPVTDDDYAVDRACARTELSCVAHALEQEQGAKEKARRLLGYQDRHTMRRRILTLRNRWPDLWSAFPTLDKLYGKRRKEAR